MASGIYAIVNTINGKRYVGSAIKIKSRMIATKKERQCLVGRVLTPEHRVHLSEAQKKRWAKCRKASETS
jgi:uncharacterized membrane protein